MIKAALAVARPGDSRGRHGTVSMFLEIQPTNEFLIGELEGNVESDKNSRKEKRVTFHRPWVSDLLTHRRIGINL